MNWTRIHNRVWRSHCDRYEINALVKVDGKGFDYAAMHDTGSARHGLGIYDSHDSNANAKAAQAACQRHAEGKPCN